MSLARMQREIRARAAASSGTLMTQYGDWWGFVSGFIHDGYNGHGLSLTSSV